MHLKLYVKTAQEFKEEEGQICSLVLIGLAFLC